MAITMDEIRRLESLSLAGRTSKDEEETLRIALRELGMRTMNPLDAVMSTSITLREAGRQQLRAEMWTGPIVGDGELPAAPVVPRPCRSADELRAGMRVRVDKIEMVLSDLGWVDPTSHAATPRHWPATDGIHGLYHKRIAEGRVTILAEAPDAATAASPKLPEGPITNEVLRAVAKQIASNVAAMAGALADYPVGPSHETLDAVASGDARAWRTHGSTTAITRERTDDIRLCLDCERDLEAEAGPPRTVTPKPCRSCGESPCAYSCAVGGPARYEAEQRAERGRRERVEAEARERAKAEDAEAYRRCAEGERYGGNRTPLQATVNAYQRRDARAARAAVREGSAAAERPWKWTVR